MSLSRRPGEHAANRMLVLDLLLGTRFGWRPLPSPVIHFGVLLILAIGIAGAAWLVYATGGTALVYAHILYVPIILAAFFYGIPGGVIAGIAAGLAVGPYMPLDVATGSAQPLENWLKRAAFFALIGATAGLALTLLRRSLRAVVHASLHDPLTGLPNRRGLLQTLDDRLASGQRDDTRFSVLALDVVPLSRYSDVVSTLGHARADSFVVDIGHTIARTLPPTAGVHYLGGLRFVIDLSDAGPGDDREIRNRLLESLDRAVDRGEVPIYIEPYIGIARYPDHGRSSLELLRAAINALVDAMSGKRQQAIYDPERRRDREDRYAILRELTDALRGDPPFVLHYQPQISVQDRRVVGAEALLRWPHPTRTWIPPGQFIELAEQTRLMRPLTA